MTRSKTRAMYERRSATVRSLHRLAGQQFEPEEGVLGRAGMDRRRRPVMSGVQRLERVERLLRQADLADDQPVRPHPQRVGDEVADVEQPALGLAGPEVVGMDRLEVESVRVLERQLGRVLDDADALGRIEQVGERSQQRRLAGAVSPATRTFALARTMRTRKSAISGLIPPSVTQSRP